MYVIVKKGSTKISDIRRKNRVKEYIYINITASTEEIELRYCDEFNLHQFQTDLREIFQSPSRMQRSLKVLNIPYLTRNSYSLK